MTWQAQIDSRRNMAKEFEKDAKTLERLSSLWPKDAPEPDQAMVNSETKAEASYYVSTPEAGKQLAFDLIQAFKIGIPGFTRKAPAQYSGKNIAATAQVQLEEVTLILTISDIGLAPNCQLVEERKTVETVSWKMVCPE